MFDFRADFFTMLEDLLILSSIDESEDSMECFLSQILDQWKLLILAKAVFIIFLIEKKIFIFFPGNHLQSFYHGKTWTRALIFKLSDS